MVSKKAREFVMSEGVTVVTGAVEREGVKLRPGACGRQDADAGQAGRRRGGRRMWRCFSRLMRGRNPAGDALL